MTRLFSLLVALLFVCPAIAADYPPVVGVALSKAVPLMKKREYAKARQILNKTLTGQGGRHKAIYLLLGNCAMLEGKTKMAADAYGEAVKLDDSDPTLWLNLGKAQYELKRYAQAAHSFRTAWEKETPEKRRAETLYYSGGALLMAGNSSRAIAVFKTLFATCPGKIKKEWRQQYIHALVEGGQVKTALPLLRDMIAVTKGEERQRWQEILLAQYVELKMYKTAATFARTLTEESPGEAKWWKALAHVHLAAGKMEQALTALLVCSWLKPLNDNEQKLLADLYMEAGVPKKAAPVYEQRLQKKFESRTLKRLVLALHRAGSDDKALQVLTRYQKAVAQSATLLQLEGEICYTSGEFAQAAQAYSRAAALKGGHKGRCWLMAGYAALQGRQYAAAGRYLRMALKFTGQKKSARGALKIVQSRLAVEKREEEEN